MNLKNTLYALLLLIFLYPAIPVNAAWYHVEVIIFDQLSPDNDGELWYENPGLPDRSNSIELIEAVADTFENRAVVENSNQQIENVLPGREEIIPYLQLDRSTLKLEGVERVLKLSREYRPLLHIAWQQPGLSANSARAVHLQKFEETEELTSEAILAGEPEDLDSLLQTSDDEEQHYYQVADSIFDGTVRIRSSKFLHVDLDFAYFPQNLNNADDSSLVDNTLFVQQQADYVRLQESRKIKLNEIHYFDHPLFGVILRVSRL